MTIIVVFLVIYMIIIISIIAIWIFDFGRRRGKGREVRGLEGVKILNILTFTPLPTMKTSITRMKVGWKLFKVEKL